MCAALPECNKEMALDRMDMLVNLAASCLAAFLPIPLKGEYAVAGKRKVGGTKDSRDWKNKRGNSFIVLY
jgi:hypothetical protein